MIHTPGMAIGRTLAPLLLRAWRLLPQSIRRMLEPLAWRLETLLGFNPTAERNTDRALPPQTHLLVPIEPSPGDLPRVKERPTLGDPEVSVVVAAHDDGVYLNACLLSVLQQSFGSWECIVVDDASIDDTLMVALRYAERDRRFRVVRHDGNLGLAATRNTGIARARARFITMLDGDDFLFQDGLLARYQSLVGVQDSAVAGSWCDASYVPAGAGLDYAVSVRGRSGVLDYTTGQGENQVLSTTPMLRTEVVRSLGGFDTSFLSAEDFEFWTRLFRNGFKLVGTGTVGVAYRQKRASLISDNPRLHLQNAHKVYDYLSHPLEPEAVCAMAPGPFIDPVQGIPNPEALVSRMVQFLTYAVLTGDQRQIDGIREFPIGGSPPRSNLVKRAVMDALRRHGYRVGGLTWAEKCHVLDQVLTLVAERKENHHLVPVRHRGKIDLSRVALDAPAPQHAPGVRRREIRTVRGRAPWDVILDPTSAAGAGDLLTLGRQLVEAGRSVAMLQSDDDPDVYRRTHAEGIRVVALPTGPTRLTITSSPCPPRIPARRHVAICTEPWITFADNTLRPDTTIVRCQWETRWRSELPDLHIGGWLSRTPRLMTRERRRTDTILVLRAPAATHGLCAADFRRYYGDTLDFVFGPGLDAASDDLVTAARIPVVMRCVRAVIVIGPAISMDAIVTGTPVIVVGAPPLRPPDDITFTTLEHLNNAILNARTARQESTPTNWLDRQIHIVNKYLQ